MMAQFLFLFLMQFIGSLFALSFRKRLPAAFLLMSGLLWGSLFWVISSLVLLVLHLPYSLISMGGLMAALAAVLIVWNIWKRNLYFNRSEVILMSGWIGGSSAIFALLSRFNLTTVSPDSLIMILNGRAFVTQGFTPFIRTQLALRGAFVPAIQAASVFLRLDYLYALQPALILVSAALFLYLCYYGMRHLLSGKRAGWLPPVLLLGMVSAYYLPFQTFYIHTNLLSGVYLMAGLGCFWLALEERNYSWLVFGILSLTAFSLLRTEAPLFGLLFLALLVSHTEIPYRVRLVTCLPFSALFAGWYLYLLAGVGQGTYILNPANILLMLSAMLGFAGLVILSRIAWVQRNLLKPLPWLLLAGLLALCVILFALDPGRMWGYLQAMLLNMSYYGLWGAGWFLVAAGLILAAALPAIPQERLFSFGIPAFLILLYAVSTRNVNFQLDWGDSANRMLTHIYPSAFLYLSLKFGRALHLPEVNEQRLPEKSRYWLAALGFGLILFVLIILRS